MIRITQIRFSLDEIQVIERSASEEAILVVLSLMLTFICAESGGALADPGSSAGGISEKAGKMMMNIMDFGVMGDFLKG